MRNFIDLTIVDGIQGNYELITDSPNAKNFAGKNLYLTYTTQRRGKVYKQSSWIICCN